MNLRPQASDVICFESNADDEHGAHSAIVMSEHGGDFPPNTLFRLSRIVPPGEWEAPGGVFPAQRLLVVTATYQPPRGGNTIVDSGGSKMCGSPFTLMYNKRETFLKGLDDLIARPVLTMEDEFARGDTWKDWKGVVYTSREEWAYVNGPARTKTDCTPGVRDAEYNGKTPKEFLTIVNNYIRERRGAMASSPLRLLPEAHAYLSIDEVLAVRIYSGPAYQPINNFLRQISSLAGEIRAEVAQHPRLTYCSTIGHICRAIRKLAAVASDEEATASLWRGVRGDLMRGFWIPDATDMVCAVDMAFMSTSRDRNCAVDYMDQKGTNVLWVLQPKPESDSGFHHGASIEMLSQFSAEKEVLFPPCTMLAVKEERKMAEARTAGDKTRIKKLEDERNTPWSHYEASNISENGRTFLSINVLPTFL